MAMRRPVSSVKLATLNTVMSFPEESAAFLHIAQAPVMHYVHATEYVMLL